MAALAETPEVAAPTAKKFIVGGNWKSNGTTASVGALIEVLNSKPAPAHVDVVVCPMDIHIPTAMATLNKDIQVGAQNCSLTGNGAFTGEVSAAAYKDLGIGWVVTGHSERRTLFGETSAQVATKTKAAVDAGLQVMACVGEELETRKAGTTLQVVLEDHMAAFLGVLTEADWSKVCVAYEPVWAIGTGLTASPEQAQEVHAAIRGWLTEKVSPEAAKAVRIMYGGSVKPANAKELAACPDIDGFLVGGASLTKDFLEVVAAF